MDAENHKLLGTLEKIVDKCHGNDLPHIRVTLESHSKTLLEHGTILSGLKAELSGLKADGKWTRPILIGIMLAIIGGALATILTR